jgi:hypothetical protein
VVVQGTPVTNNLTGQHIQMSMIISTFDKRLNASATGKDDANRKIRI